MQKFLLALLLSSAVWAQKAVLFTGQPGAIPVSLTAGSGTLTEVTIAGTAGQITATGDCSMETTVVTCTLSIPSAFVLPGTINGLTLTTSTGTLTITNGKTVVVNNTLTVQATDGTTVVFPAPASVTTGNCMEWTKSGSTLTLTDSGAPCSAGTGDAANEVSFSGTSGTPSCTVTSNTVTVCKVTITGNITAATLAGATAGQVVTVKVTQDGTGGWTFSSSAFTGLGSVGTTAGQICSQPFKATSATAATADGPMVCDGSGSIAIPGSTSGQTTLVAPATGGGVATFFSGSDTVAGIAATQILTNKTLTSPDINDGNINVDGGTLEVPNSTSLPGTCAVGQSYMKTDATSGQRWHLCESTDTWVAQGGSGSTPNMYPLYTSTSAGSTSCPSSTTTLNGGTYTTPTISVGDRLFIRAVVQHAGSNAGSHIGLRYDGNVLTDQAGGGYMRDMGATDTIEYTGSAKVLSSSSLFVEETYNNDVRKRIWTGLTFSTTPVITVYGRDCTGGDTMQVLSFEVWIIKGGISL